jgi:hypothetical protein
MFSPGEAHVVRILPMITDAARRPLPRRPRQPIPASRQAVNRQQPWHRRLSLAIDTALGWLPVTPLGLLIAAALWAVMRINTGDQIDLIVATVGIGGLLLCLVNAPVVLAAGIWLRCRGLSAAKTIPAELETGVAVATTFRVGWISWAPLFDFELAWDEPRGFDAWFEDEYLGRTERVRPRTRGLYEAIVRRITVRDVLGLARVRFRVRVPHALRCVPGKAAVNRLPLSEQFRPGEGIGNPLGPAHGDPVDIRRYVPGDPLKFVNWRIFARTGELIVRTPERPVSPFITTLAYLVAAQGDDASASIAWTALDRRLLGHEVIFMAEGAAEPAGTPAAALDQIVHSAEHREHGGKSLDAFLTRGETSGTSATILFVSPFAGPWLERVCHAVARHRGPFRAVIGVDENTGSKLFTPRSHARPGRCPGEVRRNELLSVRERLQSAGVEVFVLDKATGQEWNPDANEDQDDVRER